MTVPWKVTWVFAAYNKNNVSAMQLNCKKIKEKINYWNFVI